MAIRNVLLRDISVDEYLGLRERNYSEAMNRFDPFRPRPEIAQEAAWWREKVEVGLHEIRGISLDGRIIGFVHAFDFDEQKRSCEIGIGIFEEGNHNNGNGKTALSSWIDLLVQTRRICSFTAETNRDNQAAVGLLQGMGFENSGNYEDDGIKWLILELKR